MFCFVLLRFAIYPLRSLFGGGPPINMGQRLCCPQRPHERPAFLWFQNWATDASRTNNVVVAAAAGAEAVVVVYSSSRSSSSIILVAALIVVIVVSYYGSRSPAIQVVLVLVLSGNKTNQTVLW